MSQEVKYNPAAASTPLDAALAVFFNLKRAEIAALHPDNPDNATLDSWNQLTNPEKLSYLKHDFSQLDKYGFPTFCKEKQMELTATGGSPVELMNALTLTWSGMSADEKLYYASKDDAGVLPWGTTPAAKKSRSARKPRNTNLVPVQSAYNLFCKDKRPDVKASQPGITISEQGRALGLLWNDLDPIIKQQYVMKSAQLAASSAESPKVKAPMTPYITFCVEKRSEIRTMYPDANFSDIGRMLGQIWGSMTADEKQIYVQLANKRNQENQDRHQQMLASLPIMQPKPYPTYPYNTAQQQQLQQQRTPIPGKGGAPTAYTAFCKDKRAEVKSAHPGISISEQGRILGAMWSAADDQTKHYYNNKVSQQSQAPLMPMPSTLVMEEEMTTRQGPSPYITFCTVKRTEVKSIFPEMSFSDMGRILGQLWTAMGDEGRSEFGRISHDLALKGDQQKAVWMQRCKLPTAFAIFCEEHRETIRHACAMSGAGYVDTIKTFTAEWCALPIERRQDYIRQAEANEQSVLSNKRKKSREKIAPSAYMLFSADKRAELANHEPKLSFSEVGKILGAAWANIDQDTLKRYKDHAERLATEAREKKAQSLLSRLPPGSISSQNAIIQKKRSAGAPSPYILYCMSKRDEVKQMYPSASFTEIGRTLGQMWKDLPPEEKKVWTSISQAEKVRKGLEGADQELSSYRAYNNDELLEHIASMGHDHEGDEADEADVDNGEHDFHGHEDDVGVGEFDA